MWLQYITIPIYGRKAIAGGYLDGDYDQEVDATCGRWDFARGEGWALVLSCGSPSLGCSPNSMRVSMGMAKWEGVKNPKSQCWQSESKNSAVQTEKAAAKTVIRFDVVQCPAVMEMTQRQLWSSWELPMRCIASSPKLSAALLGIGIKNSEHSAGNTNSQCGLGQKNGGGKRQEDVFLCYYCWWGDCKGIQGGLLSEGSSGPSFAGEIFTAGSMYLQKL